MKPKAIKVNFKMPPETAAEKMYRKHQELRKKSGLPDPEHYKKLAAQKQKEIDAMKNEEIEIDEARFSGLKPNFNKKEPMKHYGPEEPHEKDEIKDSYHKQKKERILAALEKTRQERFPNMKKEETEPIEEGIIGRVISKVINKLHSSNTKKPLPQASDRRTFEKPKMEEVEQLDEMPESSMKTRDVHAHLKKSGWSLKRTGGGHDVYAHPKSEKHIAVPRHKQLKAPLIRGIMKASRVSEEKELTEMDKSAPQPGRDGSVSHSTYGSRDKSGERGEQIHVKPITTKKAIKDALGIMKKIRAENVEVNEQLHKKGKFVSGPVKKPYKSPTVVSPIREAKDTREYDYEGDMAISQLRSMIFNAEDLIDMMDDNTNLPEWVQSKITLAEDYISTAANYLRGELSESVNLNEGRPSQRHPLEGHEYHKKTDAELEYIGKDAHKAAEAMKGHNTTAENKYRDQANDAATVRYFRKKSGTPDWYKKKYGHVKEEIEYLEEKNVPTSPEKWAQAKAQAKQKFDVYPSAYANGWAAKKYKEMGGGWKSVNEDTDEPSAAARTLSRKAQIVRDAAKGKKREQEEASDKFQKDPELSSDMQKT